MQARQQGLAVDRDVAGFGVQAAAAAQHRGGATINHLDRDRLALTNGHQRAIEQRLWFQLLRAEGAAGEAQAGNGEHSEQQTVQHA